MNTRLIKIMLSIVTALSIVACGGSGGGLAGIGGSGFISSGSISGFGSVFVNGVEFETNESTFDIEGVPGTQGDLAIGMIVRVSGTINDDGISGTATSISFDDELQGPVSKLTLLTPPDFNDVTRSFEVFGINVIIDSGTTTFDLSDDLLANTLFGFSDIAEGNNVEISGFFDTDGNLLATRVELKDFVFNPNSVVEIKGTISNFNAGANTFNLGTLPINAASAEMDNLPNGLANGQFVEVKGTFNSGTITASKVEGEDESFEDTDEFELEGLVTNYVNISSNFKIAGISVDASKATLKPLTLTLKDGDRVEAEGKIVNGVLIASEVELRGGDAKLKATFSNVNVSNNTFDVTPVISGSQPAIKVTVTNTTKIEDGVNGTKPFGLSNMVNGGYVEVNGIEDSNGGITATEVKVETADSIIVQGIIQTGSDPALGIIKIFGVEFIIDVNNTTFEDSNDNSLTLTEFFDSTSGGVTIDTTVVKVETDSANGIINKVEID